MLTSRLIVCLDVTGSRVVKGTAFVDLRDMGDPVQLAEHYERAGADEITFLDISATADERDTLLDLARRTAERLFIPLTIGGGVRSVDDIARVLRAGADKVSLNSAAVMRPEVLTEGAERFGAQCIVASIDAKRDDRGEWRVWIKGGREATTLNAIDWARECVERGAGEVLLTSIDSDGARSGYDIALIRAVSDSVSVPVIASGGAGIGAHLVDAVKEGHADAVLVAGILHDGTTTVEALKECMHRSGLNVRCVDRPRHYRTVT